MLSYTSNDIVEFNGVVLSDFANGDVVSITYPNELATVVNGKGGNSIIAKNEQGKIGDVVIRVLKGSPDDKRLNSFYTAWKDGLESFEPATMTLTKIVSVDGGVSNDITTCKYGVPTKGVDEKVNVEGDVEQAISVYNFRFANCSRSLA